MVLASGLQKAGTTLMSRAIAIGMGGSYMPEGLWDCCHNLRLQVVSRLQVVDNDRRPQVGDEDIDFDRLDLCFPNGQLFNGRMEMLFKLCPAQLGAHVLKDDDLLPYVPRVHSYAVAHSLDIRCVFFVRHPFANVHSLIKWRAFLIEERERRLGMMNASSRTYREIFGTSTDVYRNILVRKVFSHGVHASGLARRWQESAEVYLDAPRGTFSAIMRYEDFLAAPAEEVARVHVQLFGHAGSSRLNADTVRKALTLQATDASARAKAHSFEPNMKKYLSKKQRVAIARTCAEGMAAFNYTSTDVFDNVKTLSCRWGSHASARKATSNLTHGMRPTMAVVTVLGSTDRSTSAGRTRPCLLLLQMQMVRELLGDVAFVVLANAPLPQPVLSLLTSRGGIVQAPEPNATSSSKSWLQVLRRHEEVLLLSPGALVLKDDNSVVGTARWLVDGVTASHAPNPGAWVVQVPKLASSRETFRASASTDAATRELLDAAVTAKANIRAADLHVFAFDHAFMPWRPKLFVQQVSAVTKAFLSSTRPVPPFCAQEPNVQQDADLLAPICQPNQTNSSLKRRFFRWQLCSAGKIWWDAWKRVGGMLRSCKQELPCIWELDQQMALSTTRNLAIPAAPSKATLASRAATCAVDGNFVFDRPRFRRRGAGGAIIPKHDGTK